ncbi:hypothetical protein ACROYT_G016049 [Oculina patagonica]
MIKQRNFLCGRNLLYHLQVDNNLSGKMATRVTPLNVSAEEFRAIFGDSDEEDTGNIDGDSSDIDFEGIDEDGEESDEEIDNEGADENDHEEPRQQWTANLSNIAAGEFSARSGIVVDVGDEPKADDFFTLMFGEDLFDKIVEETNRYARQKLADNQQRLAKWRDITKPELKAYFGICVIMGLNILPKVADYWSSDIFMGNEGIKRVMPKNRFEEISQYLHLNDTSREPARGEANFDRLYKCRPALTAVLRNVQRCYSPTKNISIDEGMIAFKGRLSFRQYLPAKPTKYGIKVWMAADASNGFVINFSVYLGSDGQIRRRHGLGYDVVMDMARPFLRRKHHVFFDNFFSSPVLLEHLLDQQTYACSTVRCTRKDLPPCAKNKLRQPGQTITRQRGSLLFTKWHDKRDVAFLSTNVSPEEPSRTVQRKKNGRNIEIQKPRVSDVYTANMGGVDRADQFRSYYTVGRQSRKWYRYIFWFLFNVAACNGYILECEHRRGRHQRKRSQAAFRLELGKRLINGFNCRKRQANQVADQEPQRNHQATRIEGRKKECVKCKSAGRKTAKGYPVETRNKCQQCGVALCKVGCFDAYHREDA